MFCVKSISVCKKCVIETKSRGDKKVWKIQGGNLYRWRNVAHLAKVNVLSSPFPAPSRVPPGHFSSVFTICSAGGGVGFGGVEYIRAHSRQISNPDHKPKDLDKGYCCPCQGYRRRRILSLSKFCWWGCHSGPCRSKTCVGYRSRACTDPCRRPWASERAPRRARHSTRARKECHHQDRPRISQPFLGWWLEPWCPGWAGGPGSVLGRRFRSWVHSSRAARPMWNGGVHIGRANN